MSKIGLIATAIVFLLPPLAAQTITVTSPNGGETLASGSAGQIAWTAVGVSQNVKIILLHEDGSRYAVITRERAFGASPYPWTVGQTVDGMAPAGNYKVRVSTIDGTVTDISDRAFAIGATGAHDFVVSDPVLEDRGDGKKGFRVTIADLGNNYRGRLTLQQYCMNMGLGNAIQQGETVDLRRGVPVTVDLFNMLPVYFGDDCGTNFRFDVNPDRAVTESDYGNNAMQKKFFWKSGHDGRFFSLRLGKNFTPACDACAVVIRPEDVDIVDSQRVRIRLEISLRNCGAQEIRGHNLDVVETWDGGRSSANVYRKTGIVIAPGNFSLIFIDVVLTRRMSNSLDFNFDCAEGGDLDANNTFHCHLNYVGF